MLWTPLVLTVLAVGLSLFGYFRMGSAVGPDKMDGAILVCAGVVCGIAAVVVFIIKFVMMAVNQ